MEDKCIHIIKTKSYHSLNNEEKELIIKWCKNEDDFVSLKNLLIGVESYKENNIFFLLVLGFPRGSREPLGLSSTTTTT